MTAPSRDKTLELPRFLKQRARRLLERLGPGYRWMKSALEGPSRDTSRIQRELALHYGLMCEMATEPGVAPAEKGHGDVTISLTTMPSRFGLVHLTIESLLQQHVRAQRVVLWLERDNFRPEDITRPLAKQRGRGLEIRFCDDLRSYKKLIPSLEAFPDETIVTCDDDVLYPPGWLATLLEAHRAYPEDICFHIGRVFVTDKRGRPLPYTRWPVAEEPAAKTIYLPTGVGGVLYPSGCFGDSEVLREDRFRDLAPKADDLWFKLMTMRNGRMSRLVEGYAPSHLGGPFHGIYTVPASQLESLYSTNALGGNDTQLAALDGAYGMLEMLQHGRK